MTPTYKLTELLFFSEPHAPEQLEILHLDEPDF
jgi:hypothetical protein